MYFCDTQNVYELQKIIARDDIRMQRRKNRLTVTTSAMSTRNDLSSNIFSIHQPAMEGTGEWTAFAMCLVGESSRNKRKSRKKWSRDWLLKKRMHSHTVLLDGNTKARTK